ncbi:MAG: lytic transglycosylase domain-containing protein [Treponema sp.]|nr:lytic transglycosylase domain-containing protein [Treponema sp.]
MNPTFRKLQLITVSLFCFASLVSCKAKTDSFGADANYFIGLQKLKENKQKEARVKFNQCIKKGSYECARKSAQALTALGNTLQKNEACLELVKRFPDSESRLIAAKQFKSCNETNLIIDVTNGLDLSAENNDLIKIRLEALKKRGDSHYLNEVYKWYTTRPISLNHYQFFRDTYSEDFDIDNPETPQQFAINFRIQIYKRNYLDAVDESSQLFEYLENGSLEVSNQLISDLGKAFLYGSDRFPSNAELFCKKAKLFEATEAEFYFWFYAGRYYDQAGLYYTQAIKCYERAIASTSSPDKKDNALWYLMKTKSNQSLDETINSIEKYASSWNDPYYFDDFFDSLIPNLIIGGRWNAFQTLSKTLDGYASTEIIAQLSYIYGRSIEENLLIVDNPELEMKAAYTKALNCGSAPYYKIMAAYRLGLSDTEVKNILFSPTTQKAIEVNKDAETLLLGYAHFGFPEKIYSEWQKFSVNQISTETSMNLSRFLKTCASQNNDYFSQSLRIASRASNRSIRELSKEEMELVYPQAFKKEIEEISYKYNLDASIMYALIRSESFFNPDIVSSAGAVGLCQLMDFTAGEIARKLKVKDFNTTDPETNIEFGTFYLAELLGRCNGSYLQAFFSYNAGITKVRRWLQGYLEDFGAKKNMPEDLFLESINISETREYGRKLISATIYYEFIYNTENYDFVSIVKNLIK